MTQDEIIDRDEVLKMATKVYGECDWHEAALHHLEAFAKLVAKRERERIKEEQQRCYVARGET